MGGAHFDSWPGQHLSRLTAFMVFLSPCRKRWCKLSPCFGRYSCPPKYLFSYCEVTCLGAGPLCEKIPLSVIPAASADHQLIELPWLPAAVWPVVAPQYSALASLIQVNLISSCLESETYSWSLTLSEISTCTCFFLLTQIVTDILIGILIFALSGLSILILNMIVLWIVFLLTVTCL